MPLRDPVAALRAEGCTVRVITGYTTRGNGNDLTPGGILLHHTASSIRSGDSGALGICVHGRSDLSGPLCLEGGTSVLTKRGVLPLRDVLVGDEVWTHRQRWRPVTHTLRRTADNVVRVRAPGLDVLATADHRWLSADGQWVESAEATSVVHATAFPVALPVPDLDGFVATEGLLRVAGLWAAEGSVHATAPGAEPYALILSPGAHEADRVEKWLDAAGLAWTRHASTGRSAGAARYYLPSRTLTAWMRQHFGEGAAGKRVPAWLLGRPDLAAAFLDGYQRGDGTQVAANERHRDYVRTYSVSRPLAFGVVMLARSLGRYAYLAQRQKPRGSVTITGRETSGAEQWIVDTYESAPIRSLRFVACAAGLAAPVRVVEPAAPMEVFDLTVEEDHSFVADGVFTHNCNIHVSRSGVVTVVALHAANHAGKGATKVLAEVRSGTAAGPDARARGLKDAVGGNSPLIGVEIENDGVGEPWTPAQVDAVIRLCAALCNMYGWTSGHVTLHREWTARKSDPSLHTDWRGMIAARISGKPVLVTHVTPFDPAAAYLRLGSKGATVRNLQVKIGVKPADGDWGPATDKAVKAWQKRNGLVADGVIGPASLAVLAKVPVPKTPVPAVVLTIAKVAPPAPKPPTWWKRTLREGSTGADVRALQKFLRIGVAGQDGVFGPATAAKVKSWQKSHGLPADGIVGPATARKMR